MLLFNPQYGYLEGMVRGFKNGLLNQTEYQALTQCDSLEDLKIHLAVSNILAKQGRNFFLGHFLWDVSERRSCGSLFFADIRSSAGQNGRRVRTHA